MRNEPYFYELIRQKSEPRIYGETPYGDRVGDIINLYEQLSSMEKLEFQAAIKNLLKSGNQILVEIALVICTNFIDRGFDKEQQYKAIQRRLLNN